MTTTKRDYECKVISSSRELSVKEKIAIKDTRSCHKLDEMTADGSEILISPDYWVELHVHNEKSDNKDYNKFVIVDKSGEKYVTGSSPFWNSFGDIVDEILDNDIEDFTVGVKAYPSNNYKGKFFLSCELIVD